MEFSDIETFARLYTNLFPETLLLVFLGHILFLKSPDKGAFLGRALVALFIATFLAHVNRIFGLWQAHLLFPSGHTTFSLGLSWSLAMLRPRSLFVTLPLVVVLGICMVSVHYHETIDILGAVPLVLVIYGGIHWLWRLPSDAPLLDRAKVCL